MNVKNVLNITYFYSHFDKMSLTHAEKILIVPMFKKSCLQWYQIPLECTSNPVNLIYKQSRPIK